MATDKLILVGRVAGAFGVKGEVKLSAYTADPLALLGYKTLRGEDGQPVLTLTSARPGKPSSGGTEVIARAAEVLTREDAEARKGLRLHVRREDLPAPDDADEFYLADLVGLDAFLEDGAPAGRVKAVHDFGAGDILELDPGDGRPTVLHPFTKAAVPVVDIAAGRIVVIPLTDAPDDGQAGAQAGPTPPAAD
jgi:16S rRNA processing protein RimM